MGPRGWMAAWLLFGSTSLFGAEPVTWERIKLDETFRSEGVTAFDVNKDGKTDVVTGDVWYENPTWKMHEIRSPGTFNGAQGYSQSFACFHHDVNQDGWIDSIIIGFPGEPCYWYQNPQNAEGHWKRHDIWHSAANESPQFRDLTGDGVPELVMASEPEQIVGYLEIPKGDDVYKKWDFRQVNEGKIPPGEGTHRYYHGIGVTDVNLDGRNDLIIPHGWWEHPEKIEGQPWVFHPHRLSQDGKGANPSADIYADDLDGDGDAELLLSSAHGRGIWWYENTGSKAEPKFEYRLLFDGFTQTHALNYADINGDGVKDLITGKRFWAHGPGGDEDAAGEVVMYWFEVQKTKGQPATFIPHKIEEGIDSGVGTQFEVADFNGDGKLDIILSNKKGTNLLLQK